MNLYNKKAMGAIIATSLLITVVVAAAVGFQNWYNTFSSETFVDIEKKGSDSSLTGIETVVGKSLYFKNNFDENITIFSIEVNNVNCNINGIYTTGIKEISLANCIENISTSTPDIIVTTNKGVFVKRIYVESPLSVENTVSFTTLPSTFVSVWNTSENSIGSSGINQISLPLENGGIYNFTVYWGDGTYDIITSWNQPEVNHTYSSAGIYKIQIEGEIKGFRFANTGDRLKLYDIEQWGSLNLGNNGEYFYGCSNMNITATDNLDLSGTTDLSSMFASASNFNSDISNWDVSSVTNMYNVFNSAYKFNQDLSNWNVSNVIFMRAMFKTATSYNQNLSVWDVDQVTDCSAFDLSTTSWTLPKPNFTSCTT